MLKNNAILPKIKDLEQLKPRKFYIKVKDITSGKQLILYNTG